jgi:hypothetical protein
LASLGHVGALVNVVDAWPCYRERHLGGRVLGNKKQRPDLAAFWAVCVLGIATCLAVVDDVPAG